ncbi:hypothetical protein DSM112329_03636 [Paraconexibacter sp. AEG42_29]|uniref:Uncharacterized protein n=1 Tax=Paraconexibacter sp. AEG42_29 TaxID=2997339 RepID=A0AAU7AYH2_9ACTN
MIARVPACPTTDGAARTQAEQRDEAHRLLAELNGTLTRLEELTAGTLTPAVADDVAHDLLATAARTGSMLVAVADTSYRAQAAEAVAHAPGDQADADRVLAVAGWLGAAGSTLRTSATQAAASVGARSLLRAGWSVRSVAATADPAPRAANASDAAAA